MLLSSDRKSDHTSAAQSIPGQIHLFSIAQWSGAMQGTCTALSTELQWVGGGSVAEGLLLQSVLLAGRWRR